MTTSPAQRVLELFDGQRLTPAQRRIARCLVDHANRAGYLSSGDVAALAGVSQPSVTRFATALGFDGYPALRDRLRVVFDGYQHNPSTVDEDPETGSGNQFQQALATEIANLQRLSDTLRDPAPLAEAGRLLVESRPLPVFGIRAAAALASSFSYFAAKVHPDVRLVQEQGSLLADRLDQARAAGAVAMLAFVLPRYPREAVDALREARAAGLRVVTVTDSPVSPAAAESDLVLPAAVGSRLVFDLHTAPSAMVTVLLQAMCDAAPTETQARLEAFERSAATRQVFLP
ncbi:MurR/RpiR family transcriptional regulator [Dactylosporangium sp. AC04546]|uniref:MurR/RpiR family transcriptional regulator n=1 Tax=unclassified Dactylosporangium TaxID=2621675 RepID=UPI001EDE1B71|nr:MurR/RpiR family transcriptional regulator [Dactylosporangium sp. AC04546]WVK82848.1 MurR/RpiR family transcriptional regulator [Dactylosporangium sp. AC04546]